MANEDFVTFKSYHDKKVLEESISILESENIEFIIEDSSIAFDPSMSNNEITKDYRLKIKPEDFQRANDILEKSIEQDLEKIPKDYYLMNFTDDELYDVVRKRDEWGSFDVMLAKKLLRRNGKGLSAMEENSMREERIQELSKPEVSSNFWIITGYICALSGGLAGIMIGLSLLLNKKTLPNGTKINAYSESQRWHGMFITVIGIGCLIIFIIIIFSDIIARVLKENF